MFPDAGAGVCAHACLVEFSLWSCVVSSLCRLDSDCGDLADLRRVVIGNVVQEERSVSGVRCFHLVLYGDSVVGPRCADGSGGYGGGPSPVRRPCLGDCVCGWLEGGVGMCEVECLQAYGGV